VFWHSLDEQTPADGDDVTVLTDEAGNFELTAAGTEPVWRQLANGGEKYIEFDGANAPLESAVSASSFNVKHLFIVAAFDLAAFDDYNGLISPLSAANGILVGDDGTTKFVNFSFPSAEYRKSGTVYAAANMQAPMSGQAELMEFRYATGFDLDNLQIGKDRDFTGRLWDGAFHFAAGFPRILTDLEIEQMRLYANLRSRLYIALDQTLEFPAPELIFDGVNAAYSETYSRFYEPPRDYESVTHSHTYEDQSKTFNEFNNQPSRRWQVEFNKITAAKAQVLDAFWENMRKTQTFNFYDYKRDKTYSGVRIENYERTHEGHASFRNNCRFSLVKF
jgi:hypothetical protein